MRVSTVPSLPLKSAALLRTVLRKSEKYKSPLLLTNYGNIVASARAASKIPENAISFGKLLEEWEEWRRHGGGVVFDDGYRPKSDWYVPHRKVVITLTELKLNAGRLICIITATRDWNYPIECYVTEHNCPFAVISPSIRLKPD